MAPESPEKQGETDNAFALCWLLGESVLNKSKGKGKDLKTAVKQ